jgi:Flp pilus assembly protein TadD
MSTRTTTKGAELRLLWKEAFAQRDAGHLEKAVATFMKLVGLRPDFEHGQAIYHLACCCEDLGRFVEADQRFREALSYEPANPYFLGGWASFLYLHGDTAEALEVHLRLLRENKGFRNREQTKIALASLGKRLGLSTEELAERMAKAEAC